MDRRTHKAHCALITQLAISKVLLMYADRRKAGKLDRKAFGEYQQRIEALGQIAQISPDIFPWERWRTRRELRKGLREQVRAAKRHRKEG